MQLNNSVALVTGGGRGFGEGIALALAEADADVAIADVDEAIARETAEKVERAGRCSAAITVDARDPASVEAMVASAQGALGDLEIAVNNAGVISIKGVGELSVNARGVFLCAQAELAVMQPRQSGRIINIASIGGKVGLPDLSHYSACTFAVIGFTNANAKEVAPEGITVNTICPGIVGTGMWRGEDGLSGRWREPGETEEQSSERHQKTLLPQGVAQTPEDMGQLAVYLAGAEHVTGQAIAVDGGFSL